MSKISWTHYFSWTLSCSVWSLVQRSTINCTEVKIQNTRFDESDGPVAKIVKGWKKMFLCWCQQKFAMRGGRQRSRGRCTCRCSHSETAGKKNMCHCLGKLVMLQQKTLTFFLSPTLTRTVRQGFFPLLPEPTLYSHINISFTVSLHHISVKYHSGYWVCVQGNAWKFILQRHKTGNSAANESGRENR